MENHIPVSAEKSATISHAAALVTPMVVIVIAAYIAAQMVSDIASIKIGIVFSLAVDMGTFIYPLTFTLRDVAHKVLGKHNVRILIITAAVVNFFMAAYFMWAASVPGDPAWGLDSEYNAILGPLWRIVIASIVAEIVSELTDTEVYHWFVTRITRRFQWARVLVSNAIAIPIDSLVFAVLAFAPLPGLQDHFLTVPWSVVWQIFLFNVAVKIVVTLVSMPLIYVVPDRDWSAD
ncbi:MAG: queuosine precursor transporter [Anaerolineae bacterium]|nr:queuosine precursor transporter [Anaerolineae bacterium]